jgi:hypothetical protein
MPVLIAWRCSLETKLPCTTSGTYGLKVSLVKLDMLEQPAKLAHMKSMARRVPVKEKVRDAVMVEGWPI